MVTFTVPTSPNGSAVSTTQVPNEFFSWFGTHFPSTGGRRSAVSIDSYENLDDDEEQEDGVFILKLPIYGKIAQRRARKRGEDVPNLKRAQYFETLHDHEVRYGTLRDVDTSFREIDWNPAQPTGGLVDEINWTPAQHTSGFARIRDSQPVSPKEL